MKANNAIQYTLQLIAAALFWMVVMMPASLKADALINVSVHNMRNPMPSKALAYVDQPGRFITATLQNVSDDPVVGHLEFDLYGPLAYGEQWTSAQGSIGVHPDALLGSNIVNFTLNPHGTMVLNGQNFNRFFERCRPSDVTVNGTMSDIYSSSLSRPNNYILPEGHYILKLMAVDDSRIILGEGRCEFDICYTASAPKILNQDMFLKMMLERQQNGKMTRSDSINMQHLKMLQGMDGFFFEKHPVFQFPVNMPYRFTWEPSHINLTSYQGSMPVFYYDFQLIQVPDSMAFEQAIQQGAVVYEQKDITTNYLDIPYWKAREFLEMRNNSTTKYLLARVKTVPYKISSDIYADDMELENEGYSEYAVAVLANLDPDAGKDDKKEDNEIEGIKATLELTKNGLPNLPSLFYTNPGEYLKLTIANDNKEDVDIALMPILKGENDWCIMPGIPAQERHKDIHTTVDGKGYGKDTVKTVITGRELTNLMGGYSIGDLLHYYENTDRFGTTPKDAYPTGHNKVVVKVLKYDEKAEVLGEMDEICDSDTEFDCKRAAGRMLNVTVTPKPGVAMTDKVSSYFVNPGKYLDMTITNDGEEDANVIVRLGLNQYGISIDPLTPISIPKGSSKTFSTQEQWEIWSVQKEEDIPTSVSKPKAGHRGEYENATLPLTFNPTNGGKNMFRATLYEVKEAPAAQNNAASGSNNSGSNASTSGSGSGSGNAAGSNNSGSTSSSNNANSSSSSSTGNSGSIATGTNSSSTGNNSSTSPARQTTLVYEWCDADSCVIAPAFHDGTQVKLEVALKSGAKFGNDPLVYLKKPSDYFEFKLKKGVANDPDLSKCAIQILFPHPSEEKKWITAVIKNHEARIPNEVEWYKLSSGQFDKLAGEHTKQQMRTTDTLSYWTITKDLLLKSGPNEVRFMLCHVEDDGSITQFGKTTATIDVEDPTKKVAVKITKKEGANLNSANVKDYFQKPQDYFSISAKRLVDEDVTVGMAMTIDNKWTSIQPLSKLSIDMLSLDNNEEKKLSADEVRKYLEANEGYYVYQNNQLTEWKKSDFSSPTDLLTSNTEHKVVLKLYKMPRVTRWNADTPHLADSLRLNVIASDSMTFSMKAENSIGVVVSLKKKAVSNHVDRIFENPGEYFSISLYNKLETEQTVRLAMCVDTSYTSFEPLQKTDGIKLGGRQDKPAKINRQDSISLTSEQINILLKSVDKEKFRKWASDAWDSWSAFNPATERIDTAAEHHLRVMAYVYNPEKENADYTTDAGRASMKDTLGMAKIPFKCFLDNSTPAQKCGDGFPEIEASKKTPHLFGTLVKGEKLIINCNQHLGSYNSGSKLTIKVGKFLVEVEEAKQDGDTKKLEGKGSFEWETKAGKFKIACEFSDLLVNDEGDCYEGTVTSAKVSAGAASRYAEAIPYSWFEESALAGSRAEYITRMKAAQGADNKMSDFYQYTKSGLIPVLGRRNTGGDALTLPAAVPVDLIASSTGGAAALGILPVDVSVLNMSIGPSHAWMNLVGTLTLPEVNTNQSKNIVMFGAPHICVSTGPDAMLLPSDGAMAMMTDYEMEIPSTGAVFSLIAPADWSDVMGGCYFGWKDGKFDVVTIKAGVTIPQLYAVDEKYKRLKDEHPRAEVAFTFRDKENWGVGLSLDAFQVEDLDDFTFTPTGGEVGIYYDHSSKETPKGVAFPDKYDFTKVGFSGNVGESGRASKENTGPWQGLYIQQVELRMPDWFSDTDETAQETDNDALTVGIKNVIIDKSGVSLSGYGAGLGRYEKEGWKFSVDTLAVNIVQAKFDDVHLTGSFRAPVFNADLGFRAGVASFMDVDTKKKGVQMEFKVQQKDSMTIDLGIADLDFNKQNTYIQLGFNTVYKKFAAEMVLGGKISFKSPDEDVRINMKDIKFAGMRLATFPKEQSNAYKSLVPTSQQTSGTETTTSGSEAAVTNKKNQKVYFDIGRWTLASPQKALGPFAISLEDCNLKVDSSKPETRLGIKLGCSASICDVFSAGGGFTVWGKLVEDHGLTYDKISLDKLSVGTKISKIGISGEFRAGDDGDIKHGFNAVFDVETPVFNLNIEGGYGQKTKSEEELDMDHQRGIAYPDSVYAWGYFYTKFESEALAKMQPFSLKGIQGGFYFNCDVEKNPRYRTLGMLVGAQATIGGDTGIQGDAKVSMVYDLANKRCSNMLIDINAKGLGDMVDVNGQIVYANPDQNTEYLDLLVTVDAENDADALASKLLGTDVGELTDTMNKANEILNKQEEESQRNSNSTRDQYANSAQNYANSSQTASDAFGSVFGQDAVKRQASRSSLDKALGQTNQYGEGERPSGREVRDSTSLVKMEVHIPFNFHVDLITKKWHIYVGEPDFSKRAEVTFIDFAAGGDAIGMSSKIYANAYLCFGNELPNNGALPEIPEDIRAALYDKNAGNAISGGWMEMKTDSTIMQNHNTFLERADMARQFGTDGGIMVGAELGGKVSVNAAVFYVDVAAHAGFDVTMQKLAEGAHCANSNGYAGGAGGFYASGQLYALFQGEFGAMVNLFFFKGKIPVITTSAAGIMQFGGPNPSWFYGTLSYNFKLLDGIFQANITSTTKAGSVCIPDQGNPLDEIKIFESVTPGDKDHAEGWDTLKTVSPYVVPEFSTVMPMGKSMTLVDDNRTMLLASQLDDDYKNSSKYEQNCLREYRFVLGENKNQDFSLYLAQHEEDNVINRAVTVKSGDNRHFTVDCGGPLTANKRYSLNLKAMAQEYCFRNGSSVKSWGNPIMKDEESGYQAEEREWSQQVEFFFLTGNAPDKLVEEDIAVARPGNGNMPYNNNMLYRDEVARPYLSLTNREHWDKMHREGTTMMGQIVTSSPQSTDDAQQSGTVYGPLELELAVVEDDVYLVRPKGLFSVPAGATNMSYIITRVDNNTQAVDTIYECPFSVYEAKNFAEEVKQYVGKSTVADFPSLNLKGAATLLNITQKWNHGSREVDALNASLSDEEVYHDRNYANGNALPNHYMLANPYYYMAYWSNFGLIGSQSVSASHPYFRLPIDNTYMELALNTPEYRNQAHYSGHLQAFPSLSGSFTASEARDMLKPAMYYRQHEGRQWGYESGRPWPALHDSIVEIVGADAMLAEKILSGIREGMKANYSKAVIQDSDMLKLPNFDAECVDEFSSALGGGTFTYRFYQSVLPFAVTTARGLSLSDVRTLCYGIGRSDDGTGVTTNMGVVDSHDVNTGFSQTSTNWGLFPLAAAVNFNSSSNKDNYTFNSSRYLNSLDAFNYRLYRISGYHTKRGKSGYTVLNADIATNAYDLSVSYDGSSISGSDAASDPVVTEKYIYISDLAVSAHSDRESAQKALTDQGYSILPYDLNTDAGGDAVYLGYKETNDESRAITNIMVRIESEALAYAPSFDYDGRTYERVNYLGNNFGDLNSNAGGKYLYLYQTRELGKETGNDKYITNLDVEILDSKKTGENRNIVYGRGWDPKKHNWQAGYNADLNLDAGGKYIYLKLDYEQRKIVISEAKEMQVISDLMIVAAKDAATAKALLEVSGNTSDGTKKSYTVIQTDLNAGAGGKTVFLGYSTSMSTYDAVTGVMIYKGKSPEKTFQIGSATYQAVPYMGSHQGNLNAGAGGEDLYLFYTRHGSDTGGKALTSIDISLFDNKTAESSDVKCWDGQNALGNIDLNKGAGGRYVYMRAKYTEFEADGNFPDEYVAPVQGYPYQLAIAGGDDAAEAQLKLLQGGYTLTNVDLNGKNRGKRIFMGYTTTTVRKNAIKDIMIHYDGKEDSNDKKYDIDGSVYKKAEILADPGSRADLNAGANGSYLYLYYTNDCNLEGTYVKSLKVLDRDHSSSSDNYARFFDSKGTYANADLDKGTTTGRYIYIQKELDTDASAKMPEMYITDIKVAGGSRDEAKEKLRQEGYKVLNVDINEKDGVSYPVYIGYKAVEKPNADCITGILLYRAEKDMTDINFNYKGKYYVRCNYDSSMGAHGDIKPAGMQTGAYYYLCVTRSNEQNGGRLALTNRISIHSSKADGPYVGSYNPDEDAVVENFDLKAGGYGKSHWLYTPSVKVDPEQVPSHGYKTGAGNFLTELGVSNSRQGADKAKSALRDNGFTVIDQDVNKGTAVWAYTGYKTGKNWESYVIDDVALYRRGSSWSGAVQYFNGQIWHHASICSGGGDLNEGAGVGSDYLYLLYHKSPVSAATRGLVALTPKADEHYYSDVAFMPFINEAGKLLPNANFNHGHNTPIFMTPVYREIVAANVPNDVKEESKQKYIKAVAIAINDSKKDAKKKLEDAGYTPIEVDMNPSFTWVAYLGYKTTSNASEAVTDIQLADCPHQFSFIRYKSNNKVYTKVPVVSNNGDDLRKGCAGRSYFLTYTYDSNGSDHPLTVESLVINTGTQSASDANLAHRVTLDSYPDDKGVANIFDGEKDHVYLLLMKDNNTNIANRMSKREVNTSGNYAYVNEMVTCGTKTESGGWEDSNFLKDTGSGAGRLNDGTTIADANDGNGGRYIFIGTKPNWTGGPYVTDVVIYSGNVIAEKTKRVTVAGTPWDKARISYGSGNLNEGATGKNLFLLYHTGSITNTLRVNATHLVVTDSYMYDYRFAERLDVNGNRSPNANLNEGGLKTAKKIYLRVEFDNK